MKSLPTTPSRLFHPADRAVSEVLGSMLVFGLVLAVMVILQVNAVPVSNAQEEFDHSHRALEDMQAVQSTVDRTAATGSGGTTSVATGVQYSPRLFLRNPSNPTGTLATAPGTVTLRNAEAVNVHTRDYLDGSTQPFDTRALTYDPNYNQYENAPVTTYEGWTLYNEFEDGTTIVSRSRPLVSGDRIAVTVLDGRLSSTSSQVAVTTTPLSVPTQSVSVRGAGGADIELTITTRLSVETWEDLLADELTDGHVRNVRSDTPGQVTVVLDGTETYELRMAKVGIGSRTTSESAHYLTVTDVPALGANGGPVSVEVRDRFNNPVSGVDVAFDATEGVFPDATVTSDENGIATSVFRPLGAEVVDITAEAELNGVSGIQPREQVTLTGVPIGPGDDDGDNIDINPSRAGTVTQERALLRDCQSADSNNQIELFDPDCTVDITFRNLSPDEKTVALARVNFYNADQAFKPKGLSPFTNRPNPEEAMIGSGSTQVGGSFVDPGALATLQPEGTAGDEQTYSVSFSRTDPSDGQTKRYNVAEGDYFVLTLLFEDGTVGTYFVGPVGTDPVNQQQLTFGAGVTGGPSATSTTGVAFSVANVAGQSVVIDSVTVDSVSGQSVTHIREIRTGTGMWEHELHASTLGASSSADSGDANNDNGYAIGTAMPLAGGLTVGSGEQAQFSLYEFTTRQGNTHTGKDMSGTTLTVTVAYTTNGTPGTAQGTVTVS